MGNNEYREAWNKLEAHVKRLAEDLPEGDKKIAAGSILFIMMTLEPSSEDYE